MFYYVRLTLLVLQHADLNPDSQTLNCKIWHLANCNIVVAYWRTQSVAPWSSVIEEVY